MSHPRIIVLTYNRPWSLYRLLQSLEAAHYNFPQNNPGWRITLEIRIDGGGGREVRYCNMNLSDILYNTVSHLTSHCSLTLLNLIDIYLILS